MNFLSNQNKKFSIYKHGVTACIKNDVFHDVEVLVKMKYNVKEEVVQEKHCIDCLMLSKLSSNYMVREFCQM